MLNLVPHFLVLLSVAAVTTSQSDVRPQIRRGISVAVLALPSSANTTDTTPETRRVAQAIAARLRSAGFTVVIAGAVHGAPLEELTAAANTANVDVALGVWAVGGSTECPAVLGPSAASPPVAPGALKLPEDQARLAGYVKQITAAARSKASAQLADALSSTGTWCHRRPSPTEDYILEGTSAPAVAISVASPEAGSLTDRIPSAIEAWVADERK